MNPEVVDVAVVGGGIAGVSVAAMLAKNLRVVVLERESHPGLHSTGRSAALFSEIYGGETIRALSRGSRDFLYSPPEGFTESPLVRPRDTLQIATVGQEKQLNDFSSLPDVAAAVRTDAVEHMRARETYLVADVAFNDDGLMLDDFDVTRLASEAGADVRLVSSDAAGLVCALKELSI